MKSYKDYLTIGDLKMAMEGLDDNIPVIVSANIMAIPLKKKTTIDFTYPKLEKALFLEPEVRLGVEKSLLF